VLLSVSALTGGGARSAKPVRPEETSMREEGGCGSCGSSCDVNANCELKRHTGEEEEGEGEEMDLADRPEPEGLNETDGHTGCSLEICPSTFSRVYFRCLGSRILLDLKILENFCYILRYCTCFFLDIFERLLISKL
jgi:hypothetical protein